MAARRGALGLLCRGLNQALNPSIAQPACALLANSNLLRIAATSLPAVTPSLRSLCSSSTLLESNLSSILAEELKHETEEYERPEEIASGPPAPFKLTEQPDDTLLTLSRTYQNEVVTIDLQVNNQPAENEDDSDLSLVAFNVAVTKDDKSLVFECESDGRAIIIQHVSFEPKDGTAQESVYTGPVFEELDASLQQSFDEYLADRGVTPELGEYLRFLIYDKEQREYQGWLKSVGQFVSK